MSIDIDWESLTTGPDGFALAESIRDFINNKFQQVALPQFIRSVRVHSFDFGPECPVVELKDICNPLPEFYEDDESEEGEEEVEGLEHEIHGGLEPEGGGAPTNLGAAHLSPLQRPAEHDDQSSHISNLPTFQPLSRIPSSLDTRIPGIRSNFSLADQFTGSRSSTPGIPGGTSNLNSYFHLPLSAGLPGTQTPLAAVAGGTPYSASWLDHHTTPWDNLSRQLPAHPQQHRYETQSPDPNKYADPSSRPSTAHSYASPHLPTTPPTPDSEHPQQHEPSPSDLQVTLHINYTGHPRLSLTAEILLDYPMPSFVNIPLKLNITGLSFDGIALVAYLAERHRTCFCFLGKEEDAERLVGEGGRKEYSPSSEADKYGDGEKAGTLLRSIQVDSEIGQKESGKQVLKNIGKVEKFVLEQVRRIFEEEFVYPSFWTFLV
ncbi:MAG: Mitochondrial distribution and morphology protein 12 [Icmadophila ericetorum]|nr:Mitochondrial distribution and morphology protein 12 [Icmadophila ericetorum]